MEQKLQLENESLEKEIQSLREFVVQQGHLPLELQEAMGKNRKSKKHRKFENSGFWNS